MKKLICFLILMQVSLIVKSQENNPLSAILNSDITKLKVVIDSLNKFEAQVIYSRIDRNEYNVPSFTDYSFNVDETKYFYPASTVKLPACVLALEKLNELSIEELDKFTSLKIDSTFTAQSKVLQDATTKSGKPSIAHYIKKILLVSDNDAFNRLYEFIGQKAFERKIV
jgi:beta-lactamase class A